MNEKQIVMETHANFNNFIIKDFMLVFEN